MSFCREVLGRKLYTKSEDNLIRIAKDSKYKIKNLKRSIIGLALIVLITSFSLGMILVQKCSYPKNYITAVDKEGTEMKTAELFIWSGWCLFIRLSHK